MTEQAQSRGRPAKIPLKVLLVEDSEFDAILIVNYLRKGGYDPDFKRVDNGESLETALRSTQWDLVISDYNMPLFSMNEALELVRRNGRDIPFIIVSGGIGEDIAVAAMKAGVNDYLMKGNLARLAPAVERELREAASRAARRQAEVTLHENELRYRLLWETSTDGMVFFDATGIMHFSNPALLKIFGYQEQEVHGKKLSLLLPDPNIYQGLNLGMNSWIGEINKKSAGETVGQHRDGSQFPVDIALSQLEWRSQIWWVAFIRDISERKKAEQELQDNKEQFRLAREIQQHLFPKSAPTVTGFDLAGGSYPAVATGGDYYDFFRFKDGCIGLLVADVSGHGVGPAMLMAETRAYLHILARNRDDLGQIMSLANEMISEDIIFERFITALFLKLFPEQGGFSYVSAGHPPGLVFDQNGEIKHQLRRTGIPLGMASCSNYSGSPFVTLEKGDLVVLYTDGIDETMAPTQAFFGIEGIQTTVRENISKPAAEIVRLLYQACRQFAQDQPQLDDVTIVVLKVAP